MESLYALRCPKCNKLYVAPKYVCPNCYNTSFERVELPPNGTVETYTTIHVPPAKYKDEAPYNIAIIRLENGLYVTARLLVEEGKAIKIGARAKYIKTDSRGIPIFSI